MNKPDKGLQAVKRVFLTRMPPNASFGIVLFALIGMGSLLAVFTPHLVGSRPAPLKTAILQINMFGQALEMYKQDNGSYPAGTNGLNDLVIHPATSTTNWHQYLDKVLPDPWGHPYRYECPGKHLTNSYDLSSAGPDGKFRTEDDIANWQSPKK